MLSGIVAGVLVVTLLNVWLFTVPPASDQNLPGLTIGVTHTQRSMDPWNHVDAVDKAGQLLRSVAPVQNQHLMGWGAGNPEPSPGVYDFASLDRRINMITAMGVEPMITLCCAPDWMKGGTPGSTDWSQLTEAPTPDHFDDFAQLAAQTAARYPQVRRFSVWNELKGFHDKSNNSWDAQAYTDLYNRVYTAVRLVRPDALLGGPYVVMDAWASSRAGGHASDINGPWGVLDQRPLAVLEYWLGHAVGADFIAVDGRTATRDKGLITTDFEATDKFATVTRWLRQRSDLPIWWVEFGADSGDPAAPSAAARRAAVMVNALVAVARAGASGVLLWSPQAVPDGAHVGLFSDTSTASGGEELPLGSLLRLVSDQLREEPQRVTTSWNPLLSLWILRSPHVVILWSPVTGIWWYEH